MSFAPQIFLTISMKLTLNGAINFSYNINTKKYSLRFVEQIESLLIKQVWMLNVMSAVNKEIIFFGQEVNWQEI